MAKPPQDGERTILFKDGTLSGTENYKHGKKFPKGLEDEVEALDMELSQLYRNALYNGEPQLVQIGVDGDAKMAAPVGRTAGARVGEAVEALRAEATADVPRDQIDDAVRVLRRIARNLGHPDA